QVWSNPFTCLRLPKIFNLRMDPYERADIVSDQFYDFQTKNVYLTEQATMRAAAFLETFIEYPPSQLPASFSVDQVEKRVNDIIEERMKKNETPAANKPAPAQGASPASK